MSEEGEIEQVCPRHFEEGDAYVLEEVDSLLVPAAAAECDAVVVCGLLEGAPLVLAKLEEGLVLAIGGGERVFGEVGLGEGGFCEDSGHCSLLEFKKTIN